MLESKISSTDIREQEKKLLKLMLRVQKLDSECSELFEQIGLSCSELQEHLGNQENFSSETWNVIEEERVKLAEQVERDLQNIRNPSKTKKTFSEKASVQQHWLFVR